jgi:hypothetical protein
MTLVFADILLGALTSTEDAAHERAMALSRSVSPDRIVSYA